MKTSFLVEFEHAEPLPDKVPLSDVLSERGYNYVHSQGGRCDVTAKLVTATECGSMWSERDVRKVKEATHG